MPSPGRVARAAALALLLRPAGAVRLEAEAAEGGREASAVSEGVDAADSPSIRGGPNTPACEVLTDSLGHGGQVCTVDEFLQKSRLVAMDLDCVLSSAQTNLDLLTKRYELEAQAETHRWKRFESELRCALTGQEDCKHMPKLSEAEQSGKHVFQGRDVRAQLLRHCREGGPVRKVIDNAERTSRYQWPTVCDLENCRKTSNSTGQMHVTLASGRKLLMLPQPSSTGWAYGYDGSKVRVLDSVDEVTRLDVLKANKGLWFASLLTLTGNLTEAQDLFFLGVQHRVQYINHDPAIVTWLTLNEGEVLRGMCVGADNKNIIDPGNSVEFFRDPLAVKSVRKADIRPYWKLTRRDYFSAVGAKVVLDAEGVPMGTLSLNINLSRIAETFLDNLSLTKNSYAVFVGKDGRLLAMDKSARRIFFNDTLPPNLFDHIPRCRKGMTPEQLKHCSWKPLKIAKLTEIFKGTGFSAANFSGILQKMFDGTSNCHVGMQHSDVHFLPTVPESMSLSSSHRSLHLVAGCAFGTVPGWGVLMGTPYVDITESAGIMVTYKKVTTDGKEMGPKNIMNVGYNAREVLLTTKLAFSSEWDLRKFPNQTVWLSVKNTGNIGVPLTAFVADKVSKEFLFVVDDFGGESFILEPTKRRVIKVVMCTSCLQDLGTYTGTVQIQANREWSRGICLPDPVVVRIQLKVQEPFFTKAMKKLAIYGFLPLSFIIIGKILHHSVRQRYKTEALQAKVVEEAIGSFSKIPHPMVLMSANSFKRLGRLVSHEEAQERHETLWLYTINEVEEFSSKNQVVFISHQWTAFGVPDPSNTQYRAMVMSLETLCTKKNWQEENVYIWVDYISIPQRHSGTQRLAINSLTVYSSRVAAFVVVAPTVVHKDLQEVCDKATYQCRAWCRAEQLSHLLARGTQNMYLAENDVLTPLTSIQGWLEQSTYVFHGDLTCCRRRHEGMLTCDKEFLVTPMLGLWAQLCLRVEDSSRAGEPGMQEAIGIHSSMGQNLDAIFPRTFWFAHATGFKEKPLFSDLTERLQVALEENSEEADVRAKIA